MKGKVKKLNDLWVGRIWRNCFVFSKDILPERYLARNAETRMKTSSVIANKSFQIMISGARVGPQRGVEFSQRNKWRSSKIFFEY